MSTNKYYEDAEKFYVEKDFQRALFLFEKSYSIDQSRETLNYIGCCNLRLGNYIVALRIFKQLLKDYPEWEIPIINVGRTYLKLNKFNKALQFLNKAAFINPENEDCEYYLGVYYEKIDRYDIARDHYEKSLSIRYEQSETHLNLGVCYVTLADELRKQPNSQSTKAEVKNLYVKALDEFDLAYKYDKECSDALKYKVSLFIRQKRYSEALEILNRLSELSLNDISTMNHTAYCYYKLNDLQNANKWIAKAKDIEPDNKALCNLMRMISSSNGANSSN